MMEGGERAREERERKNFIVRELGHNMGWTETIKDNKTPTTPR